MDGNRYVSGPVFSPQETLVRLREVERLVAESERERNPETADAALLQALGMVDDDLRDLVGAHRTWDYLRLQVDERGQRLSRVYLDPAGETHLRKIAQTMEAAGWPSGTALPSFRLSSPVSTAPSKASLQRRTSACAVYAPVSPLPLPR